MLEEVAKRCLEGTPIQSEAWLRYQFWPTDPSKRSASQYTGRLKVKYMVQARQFRKFHPDSHYASALYRYLRCFAIKYVSFASFFSLDDKHHCKVGEPGHPVAAVERGKRVIVTLDKNLVSQIMTSLDLALFQQLHCRLTSPQVLMIHFIVVKCTLD